MSNTVSLDDWLGLESNNTITVTDSSELEAKQIGGQTVVISRNHCYVWIKKGAWLTAGKEFNWKNKGAGFGINKTIVDFAQNHSLAIRIINGSNHTKCYEIPANQLVEFVEETDSITEKYGVTLFVVPWQSCKTISKDVRGIIQLLREVV